jgi:hypothetical protein
MRLTPILLAAALAAPLAAISLPASAAEVEVRVLAGTYVYSRHSTNGKVRGRLHKNNMVTIDYCTPPDADWCRVVDSPDDLYGWVHGYDLANGAKKAFVTPFVFGGGSLFFPKKPPVRSNLGSKRRRQAPFIFAGLASGTRQ